MPNVMATLPNIGVQQCKVSLVLTTTVPCSNAAKMKNPLKFAGVPQTNETISATSRPKFTILRGHIRNVSLFNKFFFPIVDTCLICEDIARQSCAMVPRWRIFGRVQHVSNPCLKFALRPHHVWKYGRHSICQSVTAEIRR